MTQQPTIAAGLVFALELDGRGGARSLDWSGVEATWLEPCVVWLHCDYRAPEAQQWLRARSGMSPAQCNYLLAEETRPGLYTAGESLLLILRVLNKNPGAEAEDMVSVRLWMTGDRIATLRMRKAFTLQAIHDDILRGEGPVGAGEWLVDLMERLAGEFHDHVFGLEARFDALETAGDARSTREARAGEEAELRIKLVDLRRFLVPQLHLLEQLVALKLGWLQEEHRLELRNASERLRRVLDDLELILHRLEVFRDERSRRSQEELNQRMYVLAIITAVFLPLSLITGLLGMNVGGVPGSERSSGFLVVCGVLAGLCALFLVVLRRRRWF